VKATKLAVFANYALARSAYVNRRKQCQGATVTPEAILVLGLITWLVCALPVAMLVGRCALGEG